MTTTEAKDLMKKILADRKKGPKVFTRQDGNKITIYTIFQEEITNFTGVIGRIIGETAPHGYITVRGTGFNKSADLVERLSYELFGDYGLLPYQEV